MDISTIVILIVVVAGFTLIFWLLSKKGKDAGQDQSLLMLQNQINEVSKTLDSRLGDSNKMMQGQLQESARIVRNVTERLTKLDETNKQVVNFADQLKNLQDILKNPKQRGILGEYYLESVLKNVLPPKTYQMQYAFKDGEIVDAVVFVKDRIIPIDAKFSLENYNRILAARDDSERSELERAFKNDL